MATHEPADAARIALYRALGLLHRRQPPPQRGYMPPMPSLSLSALVQATKPRKVNGKNRSHSALLEEVARGARVPVPALADGLIPDKPAAVIDRMQHRIYNARFIGDDGAMFVASGQDEMIRVYDTREPEKADVTHEVGVVDVNWTVTDLDVHTSAGGKTMLGYSSIGSIVQLVNLSEANERIPARDFTGRRRRRTLMQEPLQLSPHRNIAIWSFMFSQDGEQIIAGTGNRGEDRAKILVYDVVQRCLLHSIPAHDDDINSVAFLNRRSDPNLIASGSDDGVLQLFDLRESRTSSASGSEQRPAATFVGHTQGLTHVSSREDGRYFLSTSKDQTIKCWDLRVPSSATDRIKRDYSFDYRFHDARPIVPPAPGANKADKSVVTYTGGHETMKTVRQFFPSHISRLSMYIKLFQSAPHQLTLGILFCTILSTLAYSVPLFTSANNQPEVCLHGVVSIRRRGLRLRSYHRQDCEATWRRRTHGRST
jgi:DDB1- and CUL4-associated factor 11